MKYGKVDQADLDMKVYPADSSAAAVVLCNYGYFSSRIFNLYIKNASRFLKKKVNHRVIFTFLLMKKR